MAKRAAPEVNAGSMADIAFLLLIFFLVTTTIETDSGLSRKLPPMEDVVDPPVIKEKNIFQLNVNKNNELFLKTGGEEKVIKLKDLQKAAVDFLDNGGGAGDDACRRCQGKKNPRSSDNFDKAIISLQNDRGTKYETYIAVQNEILAAYNQLRNREFLRDNPNLGVNFVEAEKMYNDPRTSEEDKERLKEKLEKIKLLIPQKFSEAEPKKS
ncbi:biopolymer transporter ExbD [Mangrovimonas sp. AS39]|uniref:ExbD/TolR family protein n=1 Tax=Mangrovimonas TaxID=1211036 RepID=UPI0006B4FC9E|nr:MULTISPECIES: biopolymer transporter ExbD [Mangrovimonas]MCF1190022.1 biopolymer transporter ExbD [Mangrovimonas futianensis]MCF1194227.1 biopolymer transporter ExbD [Mangrovimonas futianensis]MCF1421692.1 biopolymer transporter ExbD [Mangrovimonas futianensis]NIK90591.1 biopolymer transporter ExbD [Mangrovimonas sp. CR14]